MLFPLAFVTMAVVISVSGRIDGSSDQQSGGKGRGGAGGGAVPKEYRFPRGFLWGTATSAYQIEGATTAKDGRGATIWDFYAAQPGKIKDNTTGALAADAYHHIEDDVARMRDMGMSVYRFSFSWSRIFPDGDAMHGDPNPEGIAYYDRLIDALIEAGIQPVVTLYHFDLPLGLHRAGGWFNHRTVEQFAYYARFCFEHFGDRVKHWITINEILTQMQLGYCGVKVEHAPGGFWPHCDWAPHVVAHHQLLAHAAAFKVYDREFRAQQNGQVGISHAAYWMEPVDAARDQAAAERAMVFHLGWFLDPVFQPKGGYPPEMVAYFDEHARKEGTFAPRLPRLTPDERYMLKNSLDFIGINYYTTLSAQEGAPNGVLIPKDSNVFAVPDTRFAAVGLPGSWIRMSPEGLKKVLRWIRKRYGDDISFMITENGVMDTPGEGLNDTSRIKYLREHLKALSEAISEGSDVQAYMTWSLLDNFEWSDGLSTKFGLHAIDRSTPELRRLPKKSVEFYKDVATFNRVKDEDENDSTSTSTTTTTAAATSTTTAATTTTAASIATTTSASPTAASTDPTSTSTAAAASPVAATTPDSTSFTTDSGSTVSPPSELSSSAPPAAAPPPPPPPSPSPVEIYSS